MNTIFSPRLPRDKHDREGSNIYIYIYIYICVVSQEALCVQYLASIGQSVAPRNPPIACHVCNQEKERHMEDFTQTGSGQTSAIYLNEWRGGNSVSDFFGFREWMNE